MKTANKLTFLSTKFFTENKREYGITVTISLDDMEYREILEKSLSAIQYLRIHGFSTYMESEGIVNRIMMFKDKNEMRNRKIKSIL